MGKDRPGDQHSSSICLRVTSLQDRASSSGPLPSFPTIPGHPGPVLGHCMGEKFFLTLMVQWECQRLAPLILEVFSIPNDSMSK